MYTPELWEKETCLYWTDFERKPYQTNHVVLVLPAGQSKSKQACHNLCHNIHFNFAALVNRVSLLWLQLQFPELDHICTACDLCTAKSKNLCCKQGTTDIAPTLAGKILYLANATLHLEDGLIGSCPKVNVASVQSHILADSRLQLTSCLSLFDLLLRSGCIADLKG